MVCIVSSESRVIKSHEPPKKLETPQRIAVTKVNPIGALPHFSYHYVSTLIYMWQVVSTSSQLDLPINPTIQSPYGFVIDPNHPYIESRQLLCM
ncbi:hypothetical protein H5410_027500 [Solanum commersonii]|uniref:Uncharacterized protein n=1 Tax=Solanum commersonii TaxID=4109 RepID=A0A9J5Z212_SOLCO|nr:hypothetical protein H5410_027500 [Solanum commersonii]